MIQQQAFSAKTAYYYFTLGYYFSVGYFAWENCIESPKALPNRQ